MNGPRTTPGTRWVGIPGVVSPPSDFDQVAQLLGRSIRSLDQRITPLASDFDGLATALGLSNGSQPLGLVGHSLGANTAVNLALDLRLRQPGQLVALVLLDPVVPTHGPLPAALGDSRVDGIAQRILSASQLVKLANRVALTIGRTNMRLDRQLSGGFYNDATTRGHRAFADWCLGTPEGLRRLWVDLRAAWLYEQALATRLDQMGQSLAQTLGLQPVLMASMRGPRAKLQAQRLYGQSLGARLVPAWGAGHLLPLSRPDLVAQVLQAAVSEDS
ncbi:MAG: alpha/beta hydrolase [Micrococcales bacterium]|nr:alpha/beta hydrolase [Micrococcales bacterium]